MKLLIGRIGPPKKLASLVKMYSGLFHEGSLSSIACKGFERKEDIKANAGFFAMGPSVHKALTKIIEPLRKELVTEDDLMKQDENGK